MLDLKIFRVFIVAVIDEIYLELLRRGKHRGPDCGGEAAR